jgi:hypothetical protein
MYRQPHMDESFRHPYAYAAARTPELLTAA